MESTKEIPQKKQLKIMAKLINKKSIYYTLQNSEISIFQQRNERRAPCIVETVAYTLHKIKAYRKLHPVL